MKFIDVILSVLKTLLSGWISRFKENNPAGYRAVGVALVGVSMAVTFFIQNEVFPTIEPTLVLIQYAAAGLAVLFGINEVADSAKRQVQEGKNPSAALAFKWRAVVYLVLIIGGFIAIIHFGNKAKGAPAEETIYLSAAPDAPVEAFSAPAEISNPETGPQPIRPYFVQVLYYRLDTLSSVPTGGLPSFRVIVRRDVTVDFPRVLSSGIPPLSLFQNVLVPGYPNQDRVFNAIILNQ